MRAKSMVLILIAGGCGLVASIGISQVMTQGESGSDNVEKVPILVANVDLGIGDKLDETSIKLEEWPVDRVPEDALTELEEVKDMVPNTRLYAGEPIIQKKLIDHLSNAMPPIPEGYRVMPLRVNEEVAPSLLLPGDRVDIMVFLRRNAEIGKTEVKTVLRDVRVFAVDSRTERILDEDEKVVANAKTVSVLVKPNQSEMLAMATELGSIRLSLRRHNDTSDDKTDGYGIDDLLGNRGEVADDRDRKKRSNDRPANANQGHTFGDFLKGQMNQSQAAPIAAIPTNDGPIHDLVVFTPDGMTQFTWRKAGELPVATVLGNSGGSPAPAPIAPAPTTTTSGPSGSGSPPADPPQGEEPPSEPSEPESEPTDSREPKEPSDL